jgi:nitrate/TMAO reductase-like tetraheme cytochrome c subunit
VKKAPISWIVLLLLAGLFSYQCSEKSPQSPARFNLSQANGCVSCHTNTDLLKELATPLPPPAESGEG